jgi:hypothetical protein
VRKKFQRVQVEKQRLENGSRKDLRSVQTRLQKMRRDEKREVS